MKKLLVTTLSITFFCTYLWAKTPQDIEPSLKFKPLQFNPPTVQKQYLTQGTTLFLLEDHELPLIQIQALVRTGTMYDPADKIGLGQMCGTLMRTGGTEFQSSDEIDNELEFIGASVESGIDIESGSVSLSVLSKDLEKGLRVFFDVLYRPAFNTKKLDIEKSKIIESIRRRNDEPFQIARREFRKLIYGNEHPLSRTLKIKTIKKISQKDLIAFHQNYFKPNNMMIAISGDFETEKIIKRIEKEFKNIKPELVQFPKIQQINFTEQTPTQHIGIAQKELNQASILLGHLGVKRHNPDRFILEVLNEILGGNSFSSRLYQEIRTKKGLAYWVGSSFSEPWDYGTIAAGCQTKSETVGQTLQSILGEIDRIKTELVPNTELQRAKNSIMNSFVFRFTSPHAIITQKMSLEYLGYPTDYLETYTQKIADVSANDILNIAQKYIHPEKFQFIIVGSPKNFDINLSTFGVIKNIDISQPD